MEISTLIRSEIEASLQAKASLLESGSVINAIISATSVCIVSLKAEKKILLAGNGGSAADAQHIAGELVSRFYYDRPALAAISLTVDTSILTAIGNDYGYEDVFSRQIEALGADGDVFFAISTSGNSKNVLKAISVAKAKGLKVIGMTGQSGGKMESTCDVLIKAPSDCTPRIQECHITIGHAICAAIEAELFPKK